MANDTITTSTYLKDITEIENFSTGFSTSLNGRLSKIDENFKKLMAKPFLKGDDGEGVVYSDEKVYDNGTFTNFGIKLAKTIFCIDNTKNINDAELTDYNSLKTALNDIGKSQLEDESYKYACELFNNSNLTIKCTTIDNKTYIFPPYYFIDSRLNDLKNLTDDSKSDFYDFSCYVVGDYDGTWHLYKKQIMPTLYYDSDINEFCWLVNGDKTGITAQGVKGDKGDSINIWICEGTLIAGENKILIDTIISPQDSESAYIYSDIKDGDFIIVYFTNANSKQDATFGIAKEQADAEPYIEYDTDNTLITIYSSIKLIDLLDEIGTGADKARGLWFNTTDDKIEILALQKGGTLTNTIYLGEAANTLKTGTGYLVPNAPHKDLYIYHNTKIPDGIKIGATNTTTISGNSITFNKTTPVPHPDDANDILSKISGNCTIYHNAPINIVSGHLNDFQFLSGKYNNDYTFNNSATVYKVHNTVLWQKIGNIINCNGKLVINDNVDNDCISYQTFSNQIFFQGIQSSIKFPIYYNGSIYTGCRNSDDKLKVDDYPNSGQYSYIYENDTFSGAASLIFGQNTTSGTEIYRTTIAQSLPLGIYLYYHNYSVEPIKYSYYFSNLYLNTEELDSLKISHIQYNFSYLLTDNIS